MFKICLRCLVVFLISIASCACYVNYEIFTGFDQITENARTNNVIIAASNKINNMSTTTIKDLRASNNTTIKPPEKLKLVKIKCPEYERPASLGTYEIPTQEDLVLFTKRTLVNMFNKYYQKTLFLLKDIKEATRATSAFEKKCRDRHKVAYRNCVKRVSKKCETITKGLVATMEGHKQSVSALLEGKTCNMTDMKTDPIQLVTKLAMESASLEFALPAFLRLIGGCSVHCSKHLSDSKTIRRPLRHMTDQDLVVKHFLTRKNYIQLIKDPTTHV